MEKLFSYLEGLKAAMLGEFAKLSTAATQQLVDANAELSKARTAAQTHEATVADLTAKLSTSEASVTDLNAKLSAATEAAGKQAETITELTDKLAAAEKKVTDAAELIAGQGLDAARLPSAATPATKSDWDTYVALLSEGKTQEAGEFYAKKADSILASKKSK